MHSGLLNPDLWAVSLEILYQGLPSEARPGRDGNLMTNRVEGGGPPRVVLPRVAGPPDVPGKTDDGDLISL